MIKAIAVDFGGVYFNFDHEKYMEEMAKLSDIKPEIVEKILLKKIFHLHVKRITEKYFLNYFCKCVGKKINHSLLKNIFEKSNKPNKPVIDMIKKLSKNYHIALLTNNTVALDRLNKKYNFYDEFDFLMSSHMVRMQKPYKNIYKLLIRRAKCKPNEIIFIDDKNRNLIPAKKLGINTIIFKNVTQLKEDLKKFGIKV